MNDFSHCMRLLANPLRVQILAHLDEGPLDYRALCQRTAIVPQTMMRHLFNLKKSRLIRLDRRGDKYSLVPGRSSFTQEGAVQVRTAGFLITIEGT